VFSCVCQLSSHFGAVKIDSIFYFSIFFGWKMIPVGTLVGQNSKQKKKNVIWGNSVFSL